MTTGSPKRPFTAEDVYRLVQVSEPRIAPDGRSVAYVVTEADREDDEYRSHVWTVPLAGGDARPLTRGKHRNTSPRWAPDGARLAFVSNRKDSRNQLWLIGLQGEPWQRTEAAKGAGAPEWSPDGRSLLFQTRTRENGETKPDDKKTPLEKHAPRVIREIIFRFDGEGQFDDSHGHLWTIAADGSEAHQITSGDWNDGQASWSPDGTRVAFISNREDDRGEKRWGDLWVAPAEGGEASKLTRSLGPCSSPVWSPDGATIAYVGNTRGDEPAANSLLWTVPSGGGEPRALSEALDRSVAPAMAGGSVAWLADGSALLCLVEDAGAVRLCRVPLSGAPEMLTSADLYLTAFDLSSDGSTVVFAATTQATPHELYALSLRDCSLRRLTHHNDALLNEVALAPAEPFDFEAADGLHIPAWIVKPIGRRDGERVPLILSIHGGPHGAFGATFIPNVHAWAARGYAVLLVNPRGSGTYDERFRRACVDDWGGRDYDDLMRGVDVAIERGIADPERLVVTGYSYGGYMTSWVVGQTERFKAAVCGAPVSDLVSFFGESDIGTWFAEREHGGPLWERWDTYRERSPLYHIHKCRTPFLLLHWEGDLRCPVGQSEELFAVLRRLRRPVEFVRYPGGFHGVYTPSQLADRIQRTADWFERWLAVEQKQTAAAAAG